MDGALTNIKQDYHIETSREIIAEQEAKVCAEGETVHTTDIGQRYAGSEVRGRLPYREAYALA